MIRGILLGAVLLCAIGSPPAPLEGAGAFPQPPPRVVLHKKAWDLLWAGAHASGTDKRAKATLALGLLPPDPETVRLAESALQDSRPAVRTAAATALGEMGSAASIPKLKGALSDRDVSVALAAGRSLLLLKNHAGYGIYYAILTRKRKSGKGLIQEQLNQFNNPKNVAEFAFDQGIGFLPYAGYGMDLLHALHQKSNSPIRAAAARVLARDPDPVSGEALAAACSDPSWIVRASAAKALARRGDPRFLPQVEQLMTDHVAVVRFTAAAAVVRLTGVEHAGSAKPK
jgi:HEAT repeat protein